MRPRGRPPGAPGGTPPGGAPGGQPRRGRPSSDDRSSGGYAEPTRKWRGDERAEHSSEEHTPICPLARRGHDALINAQLAIVGAIRGNRVVQIDCPLIVELLQLRQNFGGSARSAESDYDKVLLGHEFLRGVR